MSELGFRLRGGGVNVPFDGQFGCLSVEFYELESLPNTSGWEENAHEYLTPTRVTLLQVKYGGCLVADAVVDTNSPTLAQAQEWLMDIAKARGFR